MPAGGAWGTFNPYTYQQQHSTGRGWGPDSGRGSGSSWGAQSRPSQQQGWNTSGMYQPPPMPYSGYGASYPRGPWGGGGGYNRGQSQQPSRGYRAPGGIGMAGGMKSSQARSSQDPWEMPQMQRLMQLNQMRDLYGNIYGGDPGFSGAFGAAAAQMMDPRNRKGYFSDVGFLNALGQYDPMSHSLAGTGGWSDAYRQGGGF